MQNRYVEYKWEGKAETCAHGHLFPAIFKIIRKLNLKQDLKILDAGCGGGNLVNALYNFGFNNVWGFDASESGISLAKKTHPKIADKFFKHDAYEWKLPDSAMQNYDLIFSMEVIEHLYSPQEYLKNIYSWLSKEGYLIITTPYHGFWKNLLIALTNRFDWHFDALWEGGHIKFFSERTLLSLLQNQGFEVIRFKGVGRLPYLWKSMILAARKK